MNQTLKGTKEDAAKKRRVYVVGYGSLRVLGLMGTISAILSGLITLVLIYAAIASDEHPIFTGYRLHLDALMRCAPFILIPAAITLFCRWYSHKYYKLAASLRPVPPVREQIAIAALPADEVLLRGSDQPTAEPGELLRAAHEGMETPADQLLRAEQTASDSQ